MVTKKADIAIIGAGVVGCAIARSLSKTCPGKKIIVLEKLGDVGLETSSLNSGVLHSGIHQNSNFLKSKLAQRGSGLAVQYLESRSASVKHCGMLVAVSFDSIRRGLYKEWRDLWHLFKRGREQEIKLEILMPLVIKKIEPNIKVLAGIFIPEVCVVDPKEFTQLLYQDSLKNGAEFFFNNKLVKVVVKQKSFCLTTDNVEFSAGAVINSAGLYADEVAKLAGFTQYKIYPWRGEYYEVLGEKRNLVSRLVYPAVPANYPGKGIHFSPRVDGRLFIGPNARPVPRKDYYAEDKTPVDEFLDAARRFCPDIKAEDLKWAYSGIRPKLTDQAGESDFLIRLDGLNPPWVNLIGIESPGLSASMAIAEYVGGFFEK